MWERSLSIALLLVAGTLSAIAAEESAPPDDPPVKRCDFENYWVEPGDGSVAFYACGRFDLHEELAKINAQDPNFDMKVDLLHKMASEREKPDG